MPHSFASAFRNDIEASASGHPRQPILATISHPLRPDPVRLCSDNCDYVLNGARYLGVSLGVQVLSDGDGPPSGRLTVANIDGSAGKIALAFRDSPRVRLELYHAADFAEYDAEQDARVAIGTPAPQEVQDWIRLKNVRGDVVSVEAEIGTFDYSSEPYPAIRSVQEDLPGLYDGPPF